MPSKPGGEPILFFPIRCVEELAARFKKFLLAAEDPLLEELE